MNSLLTNPDMTGEFVITPEPNFYLVILRVSPEEAAAFNSPTDRIGVCMHIVDSNTAGTAYAYNIVDEEVDGEVVGQPGDYKIVDPDFTDAQVAVLTSESFENRVLDAIVGFCSSVWEDLDEYYETVDRERIAAAMGGVNPDLDALIKSLIG